MANRYEAVRLAPKPPTVPRSERPQNLPREHLQTYPSRRPSTTARLRRCTALQRGRSERDRMGRTVPDLRRAGRRPAGIQISTLASPFASGAAAPCPSRLLDWRSRLIWRQYRDLGSKACTSEVKVIPAPEAARVVPVRGSIRVEQSHPLVSHSHQLGTVSVLKGYILANPAEHPLPGKGRERGNERPLNSLMTRSTASSIAGVVSTLIWRNQGAARSDRPRSPRHPRAGEVGAPPTGATTERVPAPDRHRGPETIVSPVIAMAAEQ